MRPTLDPSPPIEPRDLEFSTTVAYPLIELDHAPETYQRLVANPFLGLFAFLAWLMAAGWVWLHDDLRKPNLVVRFLSLALLGVLPFLPRLWQFHCLDCGATGRLTRWREHVCPASAERRRVGRPRRWRGPSPPTQVILWLWALLLVGLVAFNLFHRPR